MVDEDKVTSQDMEKFIADDAEWKEILRDMINGDYTLKALIQDYRESQENLNEGENNNGN